MAKRLIKEGILVIRNGKRVRPEIGKAFDLTAEEIAQLDKVRPQAIAKVGSVEEDPKSTPVADKPKAGDQDLADNETEVDLSTLSRDELLAKAADMGLDVRKNASKDALIEAIQVAQDEHL